MSSTAVLDSRGIVNEEFGYLMEGRLQTKIQGAACDVRSGDMIHLLSETPSQWKNPGPDPARLLWLKIK